MDKPELYSRSTLSTFTVVTIRQLEELWPKLSWPKEPLPVLDVGCGPGDIAAKFLASRLPTGTKIVASDVNLEMVNYGKKHNSLPGVITYEVFDVMEKDLQNSSIWKHGPYGKVFSLLMLHWARDTRFAIQNINKLLVPGGEAIFSVISSFPMYGAYEEMVKDPRWMDYMKDFERFISPYYRSQDPGGEFHRLLLDEGFEVLHCWAGTFEVPYNSEEEMKELLRSVNAFVNRIPEEQKEDFMNDVFHWIYKQKGIRKDKDITSGETKLYISCSTILAVARKL